MHIIDIGKLVSPTNFAHFLFLFIQIFIQSYSYEEKKIDDRDDRSVFHVNTLNLPFLTIVFDWTSFLQTKILPDKLSFELGVFTIIFSHDIVIGTFLGSFSPLIGISIAKF